MNEYKEYGFDNMQIVKEIIRTAFSKKLFVTRPQVFMLVKALNVARIHLSTNDLEDIIKWTKK